MWGRPSIARTRPLPAAPLKQKPRVCSWELTTTAHEFPQSQVRGTTLYPTIQYRRHTDITCISTTTDNSQTSLKRHVRSYPACLNSTSPLFGYHNAGCSPPGIRIIPASNNEPIIVLNPRISRCPVLVILHGLWMRQVNQKAIAMYLLYHQLKWTIQPVIG